LRPALAFKNSAAGKPYLKPLPTICRMAGRIRLMSLIVLLVLLSGSPKASATPFELANDDGDADYGWSDFYPYAAMVRFSPPSTSWRITAVRLHATCILKGSQVFYVQIWDAGLNTVYWSAFLPSSVFKNATLDWHTIRLPNVVVTGVFYVVIVPMLTLDGSQLWISVDDDAPFSNSSFTVNVDDHAIHASLNATSIEFREDETIVVFTYPGESLGFGARLVKPDGSFLEENVTRFGEKLIVRTRDEGLLNVFAVTPGYETVGSSIRLENGLRTLYKDLLANYTTLKRNIEDMAVQINSLLKDNGQLRLQLSQSQALVRLQNERINELLTNISSLRGELDGVMAEASSLRGENTLLKIGMVLAIIVSLFLSFLEVGRRWRGK